MSFSTGAWAAASASRRSGTGLLLSVVAMMSSAAVASAPLAKRLKFAFRMLKTVSEKMISENIAIVMPVAEAVGQRIGDAIFSAGARRGKRAAAKAKQPRHRRTARPPGR